MKKISKLNTMVLAGCAVCLLLGTACTGTSAPLDRGALVLRNTVHVNTVDSLSSLSVGNGNFAYTVDATGLQSFPQRYRLGIPLGTQSQWGWHSFPNVNNYKPEEALKVYRFRDRDELYAVQFNERGRQQQAADYFRVNPHRLHLGYVGLEMTDAQGRILGPEALSDIDQRLDMWNGVIDSRFKVSGAEVATRTLCLSDCDLVASEVASPLLSAGQLKIRWSFPYATGGHADDATDWMHPDRHQTRLLQADAQSVLLERRLDETVYYVRIAWQGEATFSAADQPHTFYLTAKGDKLAFSTWFASGPEVFAHAPETDFSRFATTTAEAWQSFWQRGGAVDFSQCTDPRAPELERRVVLSQYLTAIQCAGMYPPQETGLTYNSWYGKYHLEMHWWHGAHFALWGREDLLERSMGWYSEVAPIARQIAKRQGFRGLRWMKMTDPSGTEAPSKVGSFLIWQQPHFIYLAELLYRNHPDSTYILDTYKDLVFETADFMASFVDYDGLEDRYVIKGAIPAQETLRAGETVNPPFELSYFHYALKTAQLWRQRLGMPKNMDWEIILDKLSPLAYNDDKLYLAAETALDTYIDTRFTSDHMAVLGALGMMPASRLVRKDIMANTFDWIWDNWNWGKTWGWDYPMTAMCAARLSMPEKAVDALLMDRRTNTYLVSGHNYQDGRLRLYLPGNGGLLTAVAMMCAGWDGTEGRPGVNGRGGYAPGFPKDGRWKVQWEGLRVMP